MVRDLQTMVKSYFICQKWLAVEKDDGVVGFILFFDTYCLYFSKIERLLPMASDLERKQLGYLLSKKAYHSLTDDHLWFSLFSRPPWTNFTRVQRCTCCFVLLFTTMLLNILYYDQSQEASNEKTAGGISLGPFYFTREQVDQFLS